jgi:hypothetical protein
MPELQGQQKLIKTLNDEKKENDRKFEQLTKVIEGLGLSKDGAKQLSKASANDSGSPSLPAYMSRQHSESSSLTDARKGGNVGQPVLVGMAWQVEETRDEIDRSVDQVKPTQRLLSVQDNEPDGLDSDELPHYCGLLRSLLREIEAVQYKIDYGTRGKIRESILHSHERTSDFLTGKHGHNRVYQVFCEILGDMVMGIGLCFTTVASCN